MLSDNGGPDFGQEGWRVAKELEQRLKQLEAALAQSEAARQQAEQERDEARHLLAQAAQRINCAGPVHHRIDVLRQQLTEDCEKSEAKVTALSDALAQSEAARQQAEQERDYVKNGFDHMAHLCSVWHCDAIMAEKKLRNIRSALRDLVEKWRSFAADCAIATYAAGHEDCAKDVEAILEAEPEQDETGNAVNQEDTHA